FLEHRYPVGDGDAADELGQFGDRDRRRRAQRDRLRRQVIVDEVDARRLRERRKDEAEIGVLEGEHDAAGRGAYRLYLYLSGDWRREDCEERERRERQPHCACRGPLGMAITIWRTATVAGSSCCCSRMMMFTWPS